MKTILALAILISFISCSKTFNESDELLDPPALEVKEPPPAENDSLIWQKDSVISMP